VLAEVDVERRRAISRAHTATHLVHTAVRAALGEQATQAGSENSPGRFRFDFAASSAVPASVLAEVEQQINEVALADLEVTAFVTTQDEARRMGAMALFGEKYGDRVRVVEVGDYARELCGGTHAARSGQLGMIKLLSRARSAPACAGSRGWSAGRLLLVGPRARAARAGGRGLQGAGRRGARAGRATVARLREVEKELAQLRAGQVLQQAGAFAAAAQDVGGVAVGRRRGAGRHPRRPGPHAGARRARAHPGRPAAWCWWQPAVSGPRWWRRSTTRAARGLSANAVLREAAAAVDGQGGRKDDVAQGGGTEAGRHPGRARAGEGAGASYRCWLTWWLRRRDGARPVAPSSLPYGLRRRRAACAVLPR
jgi:alanyl-tRNA synthetase